MINESENDNKELKVLEPQGDVVKSPSGENHRDVLGPKPNEARGERQKFLPVVDPDRLHAPHITPDVAAQWKPYLWQAIRFAIYDAATRADVFILVSEWNTGNNPRIPMKRLIQEIRETLNCWDNKFRFGKP